MAREEGDGGWITFRVSDTGIGIDPEHLDKLFKPFSQIDPSPTRRVGGTGLGLSITHLFCKAMGGDIAVESTPAVGSTFTIRLPARVTTSDRTIPTDHPPAKVGPDGTPTVLVIDSDPAFRDLVTRFLGKEGFRVVTASEGDEGLSRARQLRPDLITLDVMMPGLDGWALLTALKADPELSDIPVIMLTMADDRNEGFAPGGLRLPDQAPRARPPRRDPPEVPGPRPVLLGPGRRGRRGDPPRAPRDAGEGGMGRGRGRGRARRPSPPSRRDAPT